MSKRPEIVSQASGEEIQSAAGKSPRSVTVWLESEGGLTRDLLRALKSLDIEPERVEAVAVMTRPGEKKHPVLTAAGRFKDDPLWEETMEAIRRNRSALG